MRATEGITGLLPPDSVAIVTGGGSGIGRATCERLAEQGAVVAVVDIDADAAAEVASNISGHAFPVDVTDFAAMQQMVNGVVARLGIPTILFNNAGASTLVRLVDHDLDEWQRLVSLNLTAVLHGIKLVAPLMTRNGGGVIVNTSSISGVRPAVGEGAYAAAKAAVAALTATAALELAPTVRVNAVAPGAIHTQLTDPLLTYIPGAREWWAQKTPLGRIGEPADVADVVVFLCSPLARYVTGQNIVVDGGMILHGSGVDGVLDRLESGEFAPG